MNKTKTGIYLIIALTIGFGLAISFQSLLAAWIAPAGAPPSSNAVAPIYSASNATQVINGTGGLSVQGGLTADSLSSTGDLDLFGDIENSTTIQKDGSGNVIIKLGN